MKKHISYLGFALLILLFSACKKPDVPAIQQAGQVFGFTSMEEARENLGIYADIFVPTNGWMYIRSTRQIGGEMAEIRGGYREQIGGAPADGGRMSFGDLVLSFDPATGNYVLEPQDLPNHEKAARIAPLFGGTHTFRVVRDGQTVVEFDQYVPQKVDMQMTNAVQLEGSHKGISRQGLHIRWNADPSNANGVVLYLFWKGDRTDKSPYEEQTTEQIHRAVKLEDTGEAILTADFFENIPTNAILSLFFMRGNVHITQAEEDSWQFYTITQDKFDVVLMD